MDHNADRLMRGQGAQETPQPSPEPRVPAEGMRVSTVGRLGTLDSPKPRPGACRLAASAPVDGELSPNSVALLDARICDCASRRVQRRADCRSRSATIRTRSRDFAAAAATTRESCVGTAHNREHLRGLLPRGGAPPELPTAMDELHSRHCKLPTHLLDAGLPPRAPPADTQATAATHRRCDHDLRIPRILSRAGR
jgi:hypothetical protein